jgi:GH15 family glucan-1,4-alpha-glucosidase
MVNLRDASIAIIKANQAESGAYLASPNFPTYHYSWFRDGSYIAYAMDLVGEHESAARFFSWATSAVNERSERARRAIASASNGETPDPADLLDTRYTVDGAAGEADWPNNQFDGFGTLLWAIERHQRLTNGTLDEAMRSAVELLADYLAALWRFPCSDCWEEFADKIHIHTLSAIYGGLRSAARLLGEPRYAEAASEVRQFVRDEGVIDGHLAKFVGSEWVDAALIHVSTPYRLLEPGDSLMAATIAKIARDLRGEGGGVHRYIDDNYYGGGEWLLLTAYLGWYYVETGQPERARELLAWIEARADAAGNMPEQAPEHLIHPDRLAGWEAHWGPVASPLVWSHAAYLTLLVALGG